jgi:hypothetical protein
MASLLELVNPGPRFFSKPSTNSAVSKEEPQSVPVLTSAKPEYGTGILERELEGYQKQLDPRIQESQDLSVRMADALSKQAEGAALKEQNEAKQTAIRERNLGTAVRKIWENIEKSPDYQETEKLNKEYADKSVFVPSETTAPLLGVVFATIGATGMMLGGLSKGNAKAALSAMNGMAEGFTKGREDLFKKEKAAFDENLKGLQNRLTFLKSKLELAQKKAATDAEAAAHDANSAFAEANAEFLKTHNDKFGLSDTIKQLNLMYSKNEAMIKLIDQKKDAISAKLNKAYSDQRHDEIMAATKNQDWVNRFLLEESRQKGLGERAGELSQVRREIADMQQQGSTPVGMQGNNLVMVDRQGNKKLIPMEEGFSPKGGLQPRPEPKPTTPKYGYQDGQLVRLPDPRTFPLANVGTGAPPVLSPGAGAKVGQGEKVPAGIEKDIKQNAIIAENMRSTISSAEDLAKKGKLKSFGFIEGRIPYDVVQQFTSPEELRFIAQMNSLTNQQLKLQSGATVTAAEFARQKGVLPLVTDKPETVIIKLKLWQDLINTETKVLGRAYPETVKKYSGTDQLAERMDQAGATPGGSDADERSQAQSAIAKIHNSKLNPEEKEKRIKNIESSYKQRTGLDL